MAPNIGSQTVLKLYDRRSAHSLRNTEEAEEWLHTTDQKLDELNTLL